MPFALLGPALRAQTVSSCPSALQATGARKLIDRRSIKGFLTRACRYIDDALGKEVRVAGSVRSVHTATMA